MSNKHQFAVFTPDLNKLDTQELYHRIIRVLRLNTGDLVIIFDRQQHVLAELGIITKNNLALKFINNITVNQDLKPEIIVCLPLLKREALETALYSCVELGANKIQLLVAAKSEQIGQKCITNNFERLEKIMIAAAEQSKNFKIPELLAPVKLDKFLEQSELKNKTSKVFFDISGVPVLELIPEVLTTSQILLLWGPEGDLTSIEKELVLAAGFKFSKLTPTVLRASQAVALGLGLIRSVI
jgi:16S rRNA (uracil1498-N3)-methyltransferase